MHAWLFLIFLAIPAALALWLFIGRCFAHFSVTVSNLDVHIAISIRSLCNIVRLPLEIHIDLDAQRGLVMFRRLGSGDYAPVKLQTGKKNDVADAIIDVLLGPNCSGNISVRGSVGLRENAALTALAAGLLQNALRIAFGVGFGLNVLETDVRPEFGERAAWLQLEGILKVWIFHIIDAVVHARPNKNKGGKKYESDRKRYAHKPGADS